MKQCMKKTSIWSYEIIIPPPFNNPWHILIYLTISCIKINHFLRMSTCTTFLNYRYMENSLNFVKGFCWYDFELALQQVPNIMHIMDKMIKKKFSVWWELWKITKDDIKNNKKFMGRVAYLKYNSDISSF